MSDKNKLLFGGFIVSSIGMLLTPLFANKFLLIFTSLAFIHLSTYGILEVVKIKGISFEDIDQMLDAKILESKQSNNIVKMVLYYSIRPLIMLALSSLVIYIFLNALFL